MANLPERHSFASKYFNGSRSTTANAQDVFAMEVWQKYRHRYWQLAQDRQAAVENSLLLRLMVQLMVSVSILSIDITTNSHQWLVWIIIATLSGAGSWVFRQKRNQPLIIAGTLVWVLLVFSICKYTTVLLPTMGMAVLAIMPVGWINRQNLGFGMFMSWMTTILVSAFVPNPTSIFFTVLMAAIALPTLWLKYRSYLGLPPLPWDWQAKQLKAIPWLSFAKMGVVMILASLLMAAVFSTIPQLKFPELSKIADHSTVQDLAEKVKEWELDRGVSNPEQSAMFRDSDDAISSAVGQGGGDFEQTIETKFAQLSADQQGQLQAKAQAMIQYQRDLEGKSGNAAVTEQAEDLAKFLESHAQSTNGGADPLNSLAQSCPQPENCLIQGSNQQLQETYGVMARAAKIPSPVAKKSMASKEKFQENPGGANRSASSNSNFNSPSPTVAEQQPGRKSNDFNLFGIVVVLLVGVVIGCCYLWLGYEQKRQEIRRRFANLPGLEQIYRQMLKQLIRKGIVGKRVAQTPEEYASVVNSRLPPASGRIVNRISQVYTAWRYGHKPANEGVMQQLLQELMSDLQPKEK